MVTNSHPLLRLRKRNGHIEEVIVGPSAGRAVLGIVITIAIAALVWYGVIDLRDVAPFLGPLGRL